MLVVHTVKRDGLKICIKSKASDKKYILFDFFHSFVSMNCAVCIRITFLPFFVALDFVCMNVRTPNSSASQKQSLLILKMVMYVQLTQFLYFRKILVKMIKFQRKSCILFCSVLLFFIEYVCTIPSICGTAMIIIRVKYLYTVPIQWKNLKCFLMKEKSKCELNGKTETSCILDGSVELF